mgnify:CR=1 FL=1
MLSVNLQPLMDQKIRSIAMIEGIKDMSTAISSPELDALITGLTNKLSTAVSQLTAGGSSVGTLAGTAAGLELLTTVLKVILVTPDKNHNMS